MQDMEKTLGDLSKQSTVTLRWIPFHCRKEKVGSKMKHFSHVVKLQNPRQKDLNEVETALVDLAAQSNLILQNIYCSTVDYMML